jgi:signal transduction histidine kinase
MSAAAGNFSQRVVAGQALVGLAAFSSITLLTPQLLLLDWDVGLGVLSVGARLAAVALVLTAVSSLLRLRKHRYLLRSLSLGSRAIEPEELEALSEIPRALTLRYLVFSSILASSMLLPGIRPDKLDDGRAISLFILSVTIIAAASVPHYVLTRTASQRVIETAPLDPLTTLLEADELNPAPRHRVVNRLLTAVALPVALVGVGAVLIAHAHIRTFIEESRKNTAVMVARTALEPSRYGLGEAGRADAIAAAAEFGFLARIDRGQSITAPSFAREADGQITAIAPVDDGVVLVRFSAALDPAIATTGALVAILAVTLAALLGTLFGRALAEDLVLATRRVRLLGTDVVMRGPTEIARPARFNLVARLGRAIEVLAERFRVFAAAQERALEARENAQKMRGLLFASVSHDLKSPLNAILGFADLVGREELSYPQRESLELIVNRGRELLALIETILDAARVEAGQLALQHRWCDVQAVITEAVRKARDLAPDAPAEVVVEVPSGLPPVPVDPGYVTRAIAVIIAHGLRSAGAEPGTRPVRVRATPEATTESGAARPGGERVRIDVEHGSRDVKPRELEALFARQATSRGRGLTLGLSLARSVIELHGGSVDVDSAPDGAPVARCALPLTPVRTGRRRISSVPAPSEALEATRRSFGITKL